MNTAATGEMILAAAGRVSEPLRPLPFAFAKRYGVLVRELTEDTADVVLRDGAAKGRREALRHRDPAMGPAAHGLRPRLSRLLY